MDSSPLQKISPSKFTRDLAQIFIDQSVFGGDGWEKDHKNKKVSADLDWRDKVMMEVFFAGYYVAGLPILKFAHGNIKLQQQLTGSFGEEIIKILKVKGHFQESPEADYFNMLVDYRRPEYDELVKNFVIDGYIPDLKTDSYCNSIAERIASKMRYGGGNDNHNNAFIKLKSFQDDTANDLINIRARISDYIEKFDAAYELEVRINPSIENTADGADLSSEEQKYLRNRVIQMETMEMAQVHDLIANCNISFQFAKTYSIYVKDWENTKKKMADGLKSGQLPPDVSPQLFQAMIDASEMIMQKKLKMVVDAFRIKFGDSIHYYMYNYQGPNGETKKIFEIFG